MASISKLKITAAFVAHDSWYESVEQRDQAVVDLRALGGVALKILSECVEAQGIRRSRVSKAISALEDAGFVRVRELDPIFSTDVEVLPTLWGEEALDVYEQSNAAVTTH